MIARIWHGRTRIEHADEYAEYIRKTGVAGQRGIAGNLGSMVWRREDGNETEFVVVSLWETLAAVTAFAGDKYEAAVYYPEDEKYLLELEPEVLHYEVLVYEVD
ncbi:MAG: antibiotic biosynthesis monooxygenase [Gemmatimonadales bacterium]|jgi:heme-degrading monooxygenase HmoA